MYTRSNSGPLRQLCGRFCVRFLHWCVRDRVSWLINTEGELHSLYGTTSVQVGLSVALLFSSTLLNHISGMVTSEIRRRKFLNAPIESRKGGAIRVQG